MSFALKLSPAGRLAVDSSTGERTDGPQFEAPSLPAELDRSSAAGLLWLARQAFEVKLPVTLAYWREFALRLLQEVCHAGGEEREVLRAWQDVAPPPEAELLALVEAAPPMRGIEYLTAEILRQLWQDLRDLLVAQAKQHPGGAQGLLAEVNPLWRLVGRVTFHLAENKRDERRPFAFLATYSQRVSRNARVQHVPLGEALKEYAGERNQAQLTRLLEPVRRAAESVPVVRELLADRSLFQPNAWTIRQAHQFLQAVPTMETAGIVVRTPDWWSARKPPRPQVRIQIGKKPASQLGLNSLLDFSAELAIDGEPLTAAERKQLLAASDGLVLLRGRWVELDQAKLTEALDHWREVEKLYAHGVSFSEGMRLLAGVQLEAEAEEAATADWSQVVAGDWLGETLRTLRDPSESALQPGIDLQATLRPYQAEGVRWLWFMTNLGLGACLADDMGLGKTIQVIDLLLQLKRADAARPVRGKPRRGAAESSRTSLLVVPASLLGNWKQELAKFAPSLRVLFLHSSESSAEEIALAARDPTRKLADIDLVITTYGAVRRTEWLKTQPWRLVVLDEAQAIKNASSTQTKAVKQLRCRQSDRAHRHAGRESPRRFVVAVRLLLSGAAWARRRSSSSSSKRLNRRPGCAGLRRFAAARAAVHSAAPENRSRTSSPTCPTRPKCASSAGCPRSQSVLYEKAVADLAERLEEAEGHGPAGAGALDADATEADLQSSRRSILRTGSYARRDSGKFERLALLCEPIVERQEKMLVFTQFQSLCEPLAEYLGRRSSAGRDWSCSGGDASPQAGRSGARVSSTTTARRSSWSR